MDFFSLTFPDLVNLMVFYWVDVIFILHDLLEISIKCCYSNLFFFFILLFLQLYFLFVNVFPVPFIYVIATTGRLIFFPENYLLSTFSQDFWFHFMLWNLKCNVVYLLHFSTLVWHGFCEDLLGFSFFY